MGLANGSVMLVRALLLVCTAFPAGVRCSEGDASQLFRMCHSSCMQTGCTKTPGNSNTCDIACPSINRQYQPPLALQLMNWDCASDCSYHCMWALEGPKAAAAAGPVHKYYGKWPFVRILGAQEIASVLFSIGNMLAHLHNLKRYQQYLGSMPKAPGAAAGLKAPGPYGQYGSLYTYRWIWVTYSLVNVNAWLWSSVFHCRDTKVTEKFDYFSADLTVAVGLAVSLVRALQLQSPMQLTMLFLFISTGLLQHIYFMAFIKFDYGYNMKLCIAVGVLTALTWLVWVTAVRHPGRRTVYQFMLLVHAAMLLEVLDFPPLLWLFDAHALWHAATVPLTYLWYKFVFSDVAWLVHGNGSHQQQLSRPSSFAGMDELGAVKQKQ